MTSIANLMINDHRYCDDVFSETEQAVFAKDWPRAATLFARFSDSILAHFLAEETYLFPAFEAKTGIRGGPTAVMRSEHEQMRRLLQQMANDIETQEEDTYSGDAETMLIMMQQHNMKEEGVLYPMCDERLAAEKEPLIEQLSRSTMGTRG